jgi:hypothetical protein
MDDYAEQMGMLHLDTTFKTAAEVGAAIVEWRDNLE